MKTLVVGSAHLDTIAHPSAPDLRDRPGKVSVEIGGTACNIAFGLRRAGADVRLLSAWGDGAITKMVAGKIASAGIELVVDEVPGMQQGAYVTQLTMAGERESSTAFTPIEAHEFSPQRIARALENVDCIVIDANLNESAIKLLAKKANKKKIPVFGVAVSPYKVSRLLGAARYFTAMFMTQSEAAEAMEQLSVIDVAELASMGTTTIVVNHFERGAMVYSADGTRTRLTAAPVGAVRNRLGMGAAFVAGVVDGVIHYSMDYAAAARHAQDLVAVVAASESSNAYSMNALDSMVSGLYHESRNDTLTGLFVRRAFEEEYDRHRRGWNTLMLIDCDHFKRVNDTVGHDAGDQVLKAIAACIRSNLRATDVPCRWGGDEFVVLLARTDEDEATVVAERIRQAASQMDLHGVTLSIGLTKTSSGELLDDAINRADDAMYAAKRGGKNSMVWAYTPQ